MRPRPHASFRAFAAAGIVALAPLGLAAQAIPTSGPITVDNINVVGSPGIAGPANPMTFNPIGQPGIAGPANPTRVDLTRLPGIAGSSSLTFGLPISPAVVNFGVGNPGAFPLLTATGIAGSTFAPGIAGPVNPQGFNPINQPGIAGSTLTPGIAGSTSPGIAGPAGFDPFGQTAVQTPEITTPPVPDGRDRLVTPPTTIPASGGATAAIVITNDNGRTRILRRN